MGDGEQTEKVGAPGVEKMHGQAGRGVTSFAGEVTDECYLLVRGPGKESHARNIFPKH